MQNDLEAEFLSDFEQNQNIAHKICRMYTTDQESHNDLFQEITIQLWKNYSKFRGDAKFSTWMYRVALNTAISLYRKSTRTVKTDDFSEVAFKISSVEYDDTEEKQLEALLKDKYKQNINPCSFSQTFFERIGSIDGIEYYFHGSGCTAKKDDVIKLTINQSFISNLIEEQKKKINDALESIVESINDKKRLMHTIFKEL